MRGMNFTLRSAGSGSDAKVVLPARYITQGVTEKARQANQQQDFSEFSVSGSLSRFLGVLRLPRLRNTRFHGSGLRDVRTWREGVLSLKQRRCNETNQYHPTQQAPHENDWLPGNENVHGRTSGDEERLTIADIILRNPKALFRKHPLRCFVVTVSAFSTRDSEPSWGVR
jgi:hypothetical protein